MESQLQLDSQSVYIYIYTFVILRFYVIGTSSFHDISAAIYTHDQRCHALYINCWPYTGKTRELLLRPAHKGDLYYTTAHDCLLCMHPHKGCNAYLNRHSAMHCDFLHVTITPITRVARLCTSPCKPNL